ncbi:MAG: GTP-binding protein [Candidatus Heimdallarchaeota archaeon]|nr:MAG: GTP-binding protein [Candidatus Heimdallarchaeota archaeon]
MAVQDFTTKLILIGDGRVGKTSLCSHLCTQRIPGKYELTVGLNIEVHQTYLKGTSVKLVLWDLAGQQRFGCVRPGFYYGARVALIVFDLQNRGSFFDVKHWIRELRRHSSKTPFILVGNKTDLHKREVTKEEATRLAQEFSVPYFETSALHGDNVEELFQMATRMALQGTAVAY